MNIFLQLFCKPCCNSGALSLKFLKSINYLSVYQMLLGKKLGIIPQIDPTIDTMVCCH